MADYSSIINDAATKFNIDPKLLSAVINVESSGNPNAKGPSTKYGTAQGIAQLLPQTAASLGVKNPNDPAQAIPAIAKLLDENLTRYGNVADALHAYHGGTDQSNWGPKTQAYAQKVLGQIGAGQNTNLPGVPSSQNSDADAEAYFKQFTGKASPQASQEDAFFNSFAVGGKPATKSTAAPNPSQQVPSGVLGSIQSAGAGAGKAFGEGMLGLQSLVGKGLQQVSSQGPIANAAQWLINDAAKGRAKLEAENAPYQAAAPVSNVVGQIGGVLAPGAAIAKGIGAGVNLGARAANIEAAAAPLVRAISTGGASSGNVTGLAGLATRAAGGGITGTGLGAVYNPEDMGTSAIIGAAVPVVGAGLGAAGRYGANVARSLVQPFTKSGQQEIAENILRQVAAGGPNAANVAEMVPGSIPTLAEATQNPGIATLQRTIRDTNPNPFVAREAENMSARLNALAQLTGTPEELAAARLSRSASAADNYLSTNVSIPTSDTAYASLKKTPAFQAAFKQAQEMARNQGVPSIERNVVPPTPFSGAGGLKPGDVAETYVSGRGLQYVKQALDDQIDSAMRSGETGKARSVLGIKDQLLNMMDQAIPDYASARNQFASESRPIDAMQYLQSLNLTNAEGNITLSKVQNALNSLQKAQTKPGISTAKSVTQEQINSLSAIRDDLLRQAQTGAGRSAGSSTAQNLAMQNMLRNALPGKLGNLAANAPNGTVGGMAGAGLGFALGGPVGAAAGAPVGSTASKLFNALLAQQNEKISQNVANMLLNSPQGLAALQRTAGGAAPRTQVAPVLQRLLQPGALGSLSELSRQPVSSPVPAR